MSRARMVLNRITGRPQMVYGSSDTSNVRTLEFLSTTQCRTIAEIGVARGATSKAILRWLDGAGVLHLFAFEAPQVFGNLTEEYVSRGAKEVPIIHLFRPGFADHRAGSRRRGSS